MAVTPLTIRTALFVEQAFVQPWELSDPAFDRLVDLIRWGGVEIHLDGRQEWDHSYDCRIVNFVLGTFEDWGNSDSAYSNVRRMVEHSLWGQFDEAETCISTLLADAERPRDEENHVASDEFQACYEEKFCPSFRGAWWETTRLWQRLLPKDRESVTSLLRQMEPV